MNMIDEQSVAAHYNKNDLYKKIEDGLLELGVSLDSVQREDLSLVDDFHIGGSAASQFVLDQLSTDKEHNILDVGCGIGGPARFMTQTSGCNVFGVDLTRAYIEVGTRLNTLVRLNEKVTLRQGSALSLPYESSFFDGAYMIHVGMNIEKKIKLMKEVSRVLKKGKRFVFFDVMKTTEKNIVYPLPWAERAEESAVDKLEVYELALDSAGLDILNVEDKNQFAVSFFKNMIAKMKDVGPKPLGLHLLMGDNTRDKVINAYEQIREGYLTPFLMVVQK
tara:strand:- start:132 stop:962 length:831 start_codon:yes stop_codon:yes gene_type:complete